MDIKALLDLVIKVLTVLAAKTATTADDTLLKICIALQNSPALLDFITSLLKRTDGTVPAGALGTLAIDDSDSELQAAFKASPDVRALFHRRDTSVPESAEPLALGGIAAFLKFLPTILALLKTLKDAGVFTPKPATT